MQFNFLSVLFIPEHVRIFLLTCESSQQIKSRQTPSDPFAFTYICRACKSVAGGSVGTGSTAQAAPRLQMFLSRQPPLLSGFKGERGRFQKDCEFMRLVLTFISKRERDRFHFG